ncbi:MAG TPA: hypothetical protein VMJ33_09720 [Gallionella sp.]|nr:hypothetical protein [Gallionella sp.]
MNRLRDIPAIRSVPYALEAALYNQVRLALLRIANPLEIELDQLGIDIVLEKSCWTGYHCQQISLPLISWDGFDHGRNALDASVACTMHLYHQHSWLRMPQILLALERELQSRLSVK